jgi:hypothetical protein
MYSIQKHQETSLQLTTLTPNTVLKEQPKSDVAKIIAVLLDRLAKLYMVPNWDQTNTILLTEWILETYPFELTKTVVNCLTKSRKNYDPENRNWRLTPDTISKWMAEEIEIQAARVEKYIHNTKFVQQDESSEWTAERLKEWQEIIKNSEGFKKGPSLTESEIETEGQEDPPKPKYVRPNDEYVISRLLHIEWIRECFDPLTGKPNDNWISEEEFLRLQ